MKIKIIFLLSAILLFACDRNYTPKPSGYIKVHYPEKSYRLFDEDGPYSFEYPVYSIVIQDQKKNSEPYWYNIFYPEYNSTIHLSYKQIDNNVNDFIEDSRILVYKHTSRSEGIDEMPFTDTENRRYGIMYSLKGNVASSVQFFVTDSTKHFLRGSLYFNTSPNRDSLNPIINFVREDIEHLIESIEWK
jgi:gliding motility-associated lipoprotein GldD